MDAAQTNGSTLAIPRTVRTAPQKILSVLFAHGWADQKIKEYLEPLGHRVSIRSVKLLRESPLMKIAVREAEKDLADRLLSDVSDIQQRLQAEAIPSIKVLSEVRDGLHDADAGQRRGAANDLLGYTVSRKTQSESTSTHILELGLETINAMKNVMLEAGHAIPALLSGEIPGQIIEAEVEPEIMETEEVSDAAVAKNSGYSANGVENSSVASEDKGSAGTPPAPLGAIGVRQEASRGVILPSHFNSERDYDSSNG